MERMKRVLIIGAGNIGSQVVTQVARIPSIGEIGVVDPDIYESKNVMAQAIDTKDIGQSKALVQEKRLLGINPQMKVNAYVREVESMPLGFLRSACILSCVDTRRTRQFLNRWVTRMSVAWIDSGVEAHGLMARVSVFLPKSEQACMECGWSDQHYATLEQSFACSLLSPTKALPTNAPASLGALAASLQSIACEEVLRGEIAHLSESQETVFSARWHKLWVSSLPRNPLCRFDHQRWEVERVAYSPSNMRFNDLRSLLPLRRGGPVFLSLPANTFVSRLSCRRCSRIEPVFFVRRRLSLQQLTCCCGERRIPSGFEMVERLPLDPLIHQYGDWTLDQAGIELGDVLTFECNGGVSHIELGGSHGRSDF